jgi:hypothetical protein
MKKSDAQAILNGNSLDLHNKEVGEEAAQDYNIVLGRYEAMTRVGDTADKVENDEGWTVLAIHKNSITMSGTTLQSSNARVIETRAHDAGYAVLGGAGSVIAGIWQWAAD